MIMLELCRISLSEVQTRIGAMGVIIALELEPAGLFLSARWQDTNNVERRIRGQIQERFPKQSQMGSFEAANKAFAFIGDVRAKLAKFPCGQYLQAEAGGYG